MIAALGAGLCIAALALLLIGEARSSALRFIAKPLASAGFLVVAFAAHPFAATPDPVRAFATRVAIGLVLGALGDVLLLADRGFLPGLVAFLLGHLAYVAAVVPLVAPAHWLRPIALAPIAAAAGALVWLWPHLRAHAAMRIPVLAYIAVITAMVVAALALGDRRFLAGALLFFASDLAVARDKFVAPGFINRAWGLPAYYAGQLLIAWSLAAWSLAR